MGIYYRTTQCLRNQDGQGMLEYALITGLISIAAILVLTPLGMQIATFLSRVIAAF